MTRSRILLIEDEKNIVELVKYNFERQGFEVTVARDGHSGIDLARSLNPHLILLDLMLPEVDGIEVCRILRENYKTHDIPLIMLTAKSEEADVVIGLEIGADDYVIKPFNPRQLVARTRAVLRRYRQGSTGKVLRAGTIELDTVKHLASVDCQRIDLTFKEYLLLKFFMESRGRVLSRELILDEIWGMDDALLVESRVVDKHVGELRRKLGGAAGMIVTVRHFGYRFCEEQGDAA